LALTTNTLFKLQTEIARHKAERFSTDTYLTLMNDGGIKLDAEDTGPAVKEAWGRDGEYEYWVDVPPAAVGKLAFELMREKYAGDWEAVDKFRTWCEAHDVEHKFWTWS
jgi:hypothetical protein